MIRAQRRFKPTILRRVIRVNRPRLLRSSQATTRRLCTGKITRQALHWSKATSFSRAAAVGAVGSDVSRAHSPRDLWLLRCGARSIMNLLQTPALNHCCEITSGVLQVECAAILQDFFRQKRSHGPG